jgi:predicted metal-dependent hydrolase
MRNFISIIIASIILISIFLIYESKYSELIYVKSSIDGEEYLCRNRDDKEQAANILATIKERLTSIVQYLKQNHSDEESVQRLVQKFKPKQISESISGTKYTSYSVNKGEKIVFCIRSKDQEEKLIDINTLMFVAIHELAHIMTRSIGHTQEFWSNMKRLLKVGIRQKLYVRQDFKSNPVPYCGTTITDSPLDVEEEA